MHLDRQTILSSWIAECSYRISYREKLHTQNRIDEDNDQTDKLQHEEEITLYVWNQRVGYQYEDLNS